MQSHAAAGGGGGAGAAVVVHGVEVELDSGGLALVEALAVAPERVRLLSVLGVVAHQEMLLRHAQRHDEADEEHDERGGHDVPADDERAPPSCFTTCMPPLSP